MIKIFRKSKFAHPSLNEWSEPKAFSKEFKKFEDATPYVKLQITLLLCNEGMRPLFNESDPFRLLFKNDRDGREVQLCTSIKIGNNWIEVLNEEDIYTLEKMIKLSEKETRIRKNMNRVKRVQGMRGIVILDDDTILDICASWYVAQFDGCHISELEN